MIKIKLMKVTNELRVERARHKLTQQTVADNAGCVRQTIHALEVGKFNPSIELALRIVAFLNTLKSESKQISVENLFKLE